MNLILTKSTFSQNVLTLMGGNGSAQCLMILTMPVITRLYTPSELGLFAILAATVTMIAAIGALRYDAAVVLPKTDEEAYSVLLLSLTILLTMVGALIIAVLTAIIAKIDIFNLPTSLLLLIPAGVLLSSLERIFTFWRIRCKDFRSVALSHLLKSSLSQLAKILFWFVLGSSAVGLAFGLLTGLFVSAFLLYLYPKTLALKWNFRAVRNESLKRVSKAYRHFPMYSTWNILLTNLSQVFLIFFFSWLFDSVAVGLLSLADRTLRQPIGLISGSVRSAFFQKASESINHNRPLLSALIRSTVALSLFGAIPSVVILIWGPPIFVLVFGNEWTNSGQFARILAPWFFIILISSPANVLFEVTRSQGVKLIINICSVVSGFGSVVIGYLLTQDANTCLLSFSAVSCFSGLTIIFSAVHMARQMDRRVLNPSLRANPRSSAQHGAIA